MFIRPLIAAVVMAGALAGGGAWFIQSLRWRADVAGLQRAQAQADARAAAQALAVLQGDIETLAAAGRRAAAVGPTLTAQINKITGALKNAPPLPDGCRPDPVRMRSLESAVDAANRAAAGQPARPALPNSP